ncbi:MAG: hypothetical protein QG570_749, partial [Patescibacteria group bacterium]|nr:hypothetical protein [Patescibacteria group bacterium]
MPPKKFEKPVTFSGWVEDIFNLPKEVTNQTFGVIKTKHQEYLVWVAKARASDADYAEADLIRAFTEGAEALSDLQGINTTIKVNELYAKPIDTIKALGQSTIKQLTDMDDLAGYRRADAIARLTKGQVTDGRGNVPNSRYVDAGRSINNPQNLILKGLTTSRIIPLNPDALIETTPSGKLRSRMQLVKDVTGGKDPAGVGDWEDRKVVEDGIGRDRQHKPYLQLSGAFSQMAMGLESYGSRLSPKITINTQYGRALAQEVGIDLEQVLNGSRGGLKASYDLKIKDPASGRLKSLKDKRLANSGYVTIGSFHRTLAEDAGGDIRKLLSDDNLIAKALAIGPAEYATMDGEVKQFFKNFLENEEIQIRSSYLNPRGELGQAIQAKWKAAGLVPSLEGEIYSGAGAAYIKNDLQHLSNAKSTKQYLLGDASQKQIKAEALKSLKNKYGHDVKLLAEKTGEFYERLEALNEATVSANTLFASATVKDALKAVKDGDFIKAAIVNTRLLGMIPFSNKKMRSPIEWAEILLPDSAQDIVNKGIGNFTKPKIDELKKLISSTTDPVAQQRYLNQIKNLEGLDKWINPITVAKKVSDTAQTAIGIKVKGDKLNPIQNWVNERTGLFNSTVFMEWKQRDPTSMKNAQRYTMTRVNSKDAQGLYGKFGVFSVFEDIEAANLFAHPSLSTLPYIHDIQTMFTDLSNIDAFYAELARVQGHLKEGTPIPADLLDFYNNVVVPMNFHEALEGAGEFVIDKVMDGYNQYKLSGEVLLNKISDGTKMGVGKLHPADRAQFLKTFKGSGRASQLNDLYIGWLTKYNRYANFFNDYIQKNIIFGDVLTG